MFKLYNSFQSQGHVKMAYRCSKFIAYYLLSCDNSTLIFFLCRPTVILHQDQGHRHFPKGIIKLLNKSKTKTKTKNDHDGIYYAIMPSLNAMLIRDITIIVQVKTRVGKSYKRLQSQGHVNCCSKLNAYCLCSCRGKKPLKNITFSMILVLQHLNLKRSKFYRDSNPGRWCESSES